MGETFMDVTATCIFPENLYVVNAKSLICNVTIGSPYMENRKSVCITICNS